MDNNPYTITEKLHAGPRYVIYRGKRMDTGEPVILKILKDPYPAPKDLARLRDEFSLLRALSHPHIIRVLDTVMIDNRLALARSEATGMPLTEFIRMGQLVTESFLNIATQLASAVQYLHSRRIIHKNINASNIIYDPAQKHVTLCGFSLASEMSREAMLPNAQDIFEADLAYISPEQTGRLNRNIDSRTDFYSLGIVLYELLTGRLPFTSDDAMELIHGHIALKPAEPSALRPGIPTALSRIVMKLISKNEEERYQSAGGLLYDLGFCQERMAANASAESFVPGARDIPDQFRIPDRLYGRKAEMDLLMDAFRQSENGQAQALLVGGYSGVGKSKLVHHLQKSVDEHNGIFVTGKFDQFKRDIPLSAPLGAFRSLIRQLLTGNENQAAAWREAILGAVGLNGQVIIDVVPELELLIGKQPEVPDLPVTEANNRFTQVLNRFLRVFCTPGHPLCIFLDDLQWIDSATRQWIENQLSDHSLGNFLLIGAYRNNEVTPSHPLMLMAERLQQNGVILGQINLEPLALETLREMLADTLVSSEEEVAPLAGMIHQKTNGNPFFTRQCLLSLYESGAIFFSEAKQGWSYDLEKARSVRISDNVVDMMSQLILRLPGDVQDTLKLAACMGSQFNLQTISTVSQESTSTVHEKASVARQKGLIVPFHAWDKESADEFTFLHDRVQQAALALLPEEEKKTTRLTIGRLLLQEMESLEKDDKIYDIADHLNYASERITDTAEKQELSMLNLTAGIRAKKASAYETARRYTKMAMEVLPETNWANPSALTATMLVERADCEHLCGFNDEAEELYDKALAQAPSLADRSSIYQRKIHYYTNLRKFGDAYRTGRDAVKPLGVNLPSSFIPPLFVKDLVANRILLGRRKIADIIHLKEMTDERLKMAIHLMATFGRAAYQIKPELCVAMCTRMANICLQKGNTDGGFIGFLALGPIFLGAILKQRQTGYEYGQLILELAEKYQSSQYKAEVHFVVGYFAMPWRRPAADMEAYWEIAYEAGLQNGDFFHASCASCGMIQSYYMRGMNFAEINRAADRYLEFLQRIKNTEAIRTIQSVTQSIKNLTGLTQSRTSYDDGQFTESDYVKSLGDFASRHFAHYYFINKMQTLYLWGAYEKAYETALLSDRYLKDSPGMMHTAEHHFYKAMIMCALLAPSERGKQKGWMRELRKTEQFFKQNSAGCPDNFQHKSQLLSAEISRANGERAEAEQLYYASIESATRFRYQQVHALANARLISFHLESGKSRLAALHLEDAAYSFRNLGAEFYADWLLQKYPAIAGRIIGQNSGKAKSTGLAEEGESLLDLETVLKSSEAISREIRLHDLLKALMKIIIENAGAQRMVLLLKKGEELVVHGECFAGEEHIMNLEVVPFSRYNNIPRSIIHYVLRTNEPVMLDDASAADDFSNDEYIQAQKPKSILCIQLIQQGKLNGIIYLENNLTSAAFTKERIDLVTLLSGQMAISIENAFLYENLEEKVRERTRELEEEKDKSDNLLLNILPAETADELKRTGTSKAKEFNLVTVLFTDFKNFTNMSEKLNAQELVAEINYCYSAFDEIISRFGIEKIKTIGDSYMCAGGLPVEKASNPEDTLKAALEIRDFMLNEKNKRKAEGREFFEIRIGLHSGPVVAGIVGTRKFAYDIWGDTVNIASRMESSGEPGKVNISGTTHELVKNRFKCTHRGMIEAKNKGKVDMYFVEHAI